MPAFLLEAGASVVIGGSIVIGGSAVTGGSEEVGAEGGLSGAGAGEELESIWDSVGLCVVERRYVAGLFCLASCFKSP